MGLALHDPSDSTYLSNLTEHRHLPSRTDNHQQKFPRRPFHWSRGKLSKIDLKYEEHALQDLGCRLQQNFVCSDVLDHLGEPGWDSLPPHLRRRHHIAAVAFQAARGRRNKTSGSCLFPISRSAAQRRHDPHLSWLDAEKEGRILARSSARLPSDHARERRPPSLERQEAFRDSTTSKKRDFSGMADLLQEEELYRLGLLYDNEHERGSGFSLETIVHDEPVFHIRPAKRGRSKKGGASNEIARYAPVLPLELSFSTLDQDEALAAFLISPDSTERAFTERRSTSQPTLTTIYELELEPDVGLEAEPDSSADFLIKADTAPSLTVHLNTNRAAFDLSDFVTQSELSLYENDTSDEVGEEAWAFLDEHADEGEMKAIQDGEGEMEDTDSTLSPTDADVWIVLG